MFPIQEDMGFSARRAMVFPETRSKSHRDCDSLVICARASSQAREHKGSTKRASPQTLEQGFSLVFVCIRQAQHKYIRQAQHKCIVIRIIRIIRG